MNYLPSDKKLVIAGRTLYRDDIRYLGYSATSISFYFKGNKVYADFYSDPEKHESFEKAWFAILVNDSENMYIRRSLDKNKEKIKIFDIADFSDSDKNPDGTFKLTILKLTEPEYGVCGVGEITVEDGEIVEPKVDNKKLKLQVIGDSISCGYGNEGNATDMVHDTANQNVARAYSYLLSKDLNADLEIVAWNGKGVISAYIGAGPDIVDKADDSWLVTMLYEYTDAGTSKNYFGESQENWEKWDHSNFEPDIIVMLLGTNDSTYARDIPERHEEFKNAYVNFLKRVHTLHPQAKIICTLGVMDPRLNETVEAAVNEFSKEFSDTAYYQFLEQHDENIDGTGTFYHPNTKTHERIEKVLKERIDSIMN